MLASFIMLPCTELGSRMRFSPAAADTSWCLEHPRPLPPPSAGVAAAAGASPEAHQSERVHCLVARQSGTLHGTILGYQYSIQWRACFLLDPSMQPRGPRPVCRQNRQKRCSTTKERGSCTNKSAKTERNDTTQTTSVRLPPRPTEMQFMCLKIENSEASWNVEKFNLFL